MFIKFYYWTFFWASSDAPKYSYKNNFSFIVDSVPTLADRGCRVVSEMNSHGR
jgi:hypothetical protein